MHEALPGVPDAAVHLDRRLADGPRRAGAIGLGDPSGRPGRPWARARRPPTPRTPRDARRALHQALRLGQEMLHRLERPHRDAELPARPGVGHRDLEHPPHRGPDTGPRLVSASPSAVHTTRSASMSRRARVFVSGRRAHGDRLHRAGVRSAPAAASTPSQASWRTPSARRRPPAHTPRPPAPDPSTAYSVSVVRPPATTAAAASPPDSATGTPSRARTPARRARSATSSGPVNATSATWAPRASATIAASTAPANGAPFPASSCSSNQPASRTAAASCFALVVSSRSATVAGPSSRASRRAERRSSACSGVSRVSTGSRM